MIDLREKPTKKELFVMNSLYQKSHTINSLKSYFSPYFIGMTRPTEQKVFLLLLAILSMQGIQSIRFLYHWFLQKVSSAKLNAYYYLLSYGEISLDALCRTTIQIALSCVPAELTEYPYFLIIDDTLQPKFGTHFEEYQVMFDHAAHNGNNYLKGHCFVGLVLCVPVLNEGKLTYLSVPIRYRLRSKDEKKLDIAAEMIVRSLPSFPSEKQVILLCDSWYPKGAVRKAVSAHSQLELVVNVRVDTKLYDLPPEPTGKRGRPPKKGQPLTIQEDFQLIHQLGDYYIGTRKVMTNLFPVPVYAMVSAGNTDNPSTYRLFISTLMPEDIFSNAALEESWEEEIIEKEDIDQALLPFTLYGFRWRIETIFYEQKTFWSFGEYRIRSKVGIERYINFTAIVYSCMQLLPYQQGQYVHLKKESTQVKKQLLGSAIQEEVFFYTFVSSLENKINSLGILRAFDQWCKKKRYLQ